MIFVYGFVCYSNRTFEKDLTFLRKALHPTMTFIVLETLCAEHAVISFFYYQGLFTGKNRVANYVSMVLFPFMTLMLHLGMSFIVFAISDCCNYKLLWKGHVTTREYFLNSKWTERKWTGIFWAAFIVAMVAEILIPYMFRIEDDEEN